MEVKSERTLLMTDVVDSARLTRELGDERAATLWRAHDRACRDLLDVWDGREIDKSDGFLLLFDSVAAAVGYSAGYHEALKRLDVPMAARAAIHHSTVTLRENTPADVARGAKPLEVDGIAKAITARAMSIAEGGQTLLTADARAALGEAGPALEPCGHWRIKGVDEAIELFSVAQAGVAGPRNERTDKGYRVVRRGDLWVPLSELRHSVPAERDLFVGRSAQLRDLARRLAQGSRLVSLLGAGGTGKTRLAQRLAWAWLGDYPGGAWFCDLSQARSLDGVVNAVAQGLDVPLGKLDPVAQIGDAIAGRGPCLVVLDNFEQVRSLAEQTVGAWLERSRHSQFVITTREVLGIPGEEVLEVTPLEPDEALQLFLRRAEAATAGFDPVGSDRQATEAVVRLLDGLPLAIELAAARIRTLPPPLLLERMSELRAADFSRRSS